MKPTQTHIWKNTCKGFMLACAVFLSGSAQAATTGTGFQEIAPLNIIISEISPMEIIYDNQNVEISAETLTQLRIMALRLRRGDERIVITAYSDNKSVADNEDLEHKEALRLSFVRTMLLRDALVNFGAPEGKIDLKAFGVSDDSALNNRVFITPIDPVIP